MNSLEDTAKNRSPASHFGTLWQTPDSVPDVFDFLKNYADISAEDLLEICQIDQANRWRFSVGVSAERYFDELPTIAKCKRLKLALIHNEFRLLKECGIAASVDQFVVRFPDLAEILQAVLTTDECQTREPPPAKAMSPLKDTWRTGNQIVGRGDIGANEPTISFIENPVTSNPAFIGRYRVLRVLGDGGFGRVYLAHDDVLDRNVAVKIPHRHLVSKSSDVELYLTEARILSKLDHHAIVPVYDCGQTDNGVCYIVSKFVDGSDLATKMKQTPYTNVAAAELIATVGESLHYAHVNGVVHRDVKPANILIDSHDRPYLADFGVALREEDFGTGYTRVGTVAYMSPEQLRGEGHLVDGRSDIFSLGVVLYELISGKRPFTSNRIEHSSAHVEPRPPRQIDDSIPRELERICLKALAHRVIDRYNTAIDVATDLRLFLQAGTVLNVAPPRVAGLSGNSSHSSNGHVVNDPGLQIVPKGLRSFDRDDAGFFLELLPGLRGRDGLPETVRFWKARIQASDAETFRVGVIYGPSGCGKSSFLKAGVLPLLSHDIVPVYVESTRLETEARLLKALRKNCPELPCEFGLVESLTWLRRRVSGQRVLIVLDQFEQWLHSRSDSSADELLRAIRQCDGVHLQCIITVRDDFWMAVTHFMDNLEVSLVPGNNLAAVELFNVRHARKVLTAIGQAYGVLPKKFQEISKGERAFVNAAVADLAENDHVIPVQLALFAEMVKGKEWATATLKSVGGAEGVGVTFLEETFNGRTANPHHRLHQRAARAVLQALLSEGGSGIKGAMRSHQELLSVSGYADNPQEFDSLLRILDAELRLITPTEPEGLDTSVGSSSALSNNAERFYHLTHDYLVPSLKEWLTRKQKETRRGRAELILADRAAAWNQCPANRSLPSLLEWLNILFFAGMRSRRAYQAVLNASAGYYGSRAVSAFLLLGLAVWGVRERINQTRASLIVGSLKNTRCRDVPNIMESLAPYRRIADPLLQELIESSKNPTTRLYAAMTLLHAEPSLQAVVYEGLLGASPDDFSTICDTLAKWGDKSSIKEQLWTELLDEENQPERRFRAGAALATFDSPDEGTPSPKWQQVTGFLGERLVQEIGTNLGDLSEWVSAFWPARKVLSPELHRIYSQSTGPEIDRYAAVKALAQFVTDQPAQLADLILLANRREYSFLVSKLKELGQPGENALLNEFTAISPAGETLESRNRLAKRRAHAAVALLEFNRTDPLLNVLCAPSNPTLWSYTEDRLTKLAARPELLCRLLDSADTNLRAALLRSLAGMNFEFFSRELRDRVALVVTRLFKTDPDPGVHSATEWAMRSWGLNDQLAEFTRELATGSPSAGHKWYLNRHGDTLVIFEGPLESRTGSPPDERGRDSDESLSTRTINRTFAISTKEVTLEQFVKIVPNFRHAKPKEETLPPNQPGSMMTWHRAAEYCVGLSKVEGIPEDQLCYYAIENFAEQEKSYWQPAKDYLTRSGYRLPTEAEWEYACRAGTETPYFWGDDPELALRYAAMNLNSETHTWPVGSKCPNQFGFFDICGNVAEWTHDRNRKLPDHGEDTEDDKPLEAQSERVIRGGNCLDPAINLRSANRSPQFARSGVSPRIGFRIARSLAVVKREQ